MGIGVLGPLTLDGVTVPLRRHDRVVLTALAVHPGEPVSADRLADAVWGDQPPDTWSKVVQGCVSRLRKLLGRAAIETTPQGYRLVVGTEELDTQRFERKLARGRELLALSEPDRAAYLLGEAIALWRGEAFAELDGWDVGRVERARLEELLRDAEELAVDARLRAGHATETIGRARTMTAEAPLRERRWALLALALYQSGQQAAALRTIRQVRSILSRELGLDLGPELVALEQAILRQDPALVVETVLPEPSEACPYRGLVPYGVADGEAFFGREREVAECLSRLEEHGALAVVGPSGSGKSSLVRAGVAATLERAGRRVLVVTPGVHPVEALAPVSTSGPVPVLVVDQCEEVFSLCEFAGERAEFLRMLTEHAARAPLVVALRADRIGETSLSPAFARLVEQGLFLLGAMGPAELRACIEGPALQAGLLLEPGLVDLLVREVEDEPGALPLLSHALRETWAYREGRTLTVAGYRASGGIRGAVARSAEQVFDELSDDQRPLVRDLMLRLVTPGVEGEPVRNRMPRRLVADDVRHEEVIERLVTARLVTSDDGVIALAHEALVRAWPRFRQWLEDDTEGQRILRHLTVAADTWASMGRPGSELYRGVRLARALDWRQATGPRLTVVEEEFLDASRAAVDAELDEARRRAGEEGRARRRTHRLAVALAGALMLALVAAAGAAWFQRAATDRAADAAQASTEADANRLAALSKSVRSLDLSLLLAAEAFRTVDTPATRDGLLGAVVARQRAEQVIQLDERPMDAALGEDGKTLFIAMPSEVVAWRLGSTAPPAVVVRWGHVFDRIAASPTRDLVALMSWKDDQTPRIGVFDAEGRQRLLVEGFDRIGGWPKEVGFSRDGRRLLATVLHGEDPGVRRTLLREYDVATGDLLSSTRLQQVGASGQWPTAALGPDGIPAVSWVQGAPGPATLLAARDVGPVSVRVGDRDATALTFLPFPGGVAQVWDDGVLTLYDTAGRHSQVLQVHRARVRDLAVSPTGRWAATADEAGQVVVWDIASRTGEWIPRELQLGHDGRVAALAVDPRGRTLVTVSHDGTAVTWDLSPRAGLGVAIPGLRTHWLSNRPATVVPGELLVAPARRAPREGFEWWQSTTVSALFLDPRTGTVVDRIRVGQNMGFIFGSSVSLSPDRSLIAVTYGYGAAVLDARSRQIVARVELDDIEMFGQRRPEPVWCSAWTPDASRLLLCADGDEFDSEDGGLVVVDTSTWEPEPQRIDLDGAAQTIELSPDGRRFAVGMTVPSVDDAPPGIVRLLDAETLDLEQVIRMDTDDFAYDLSFSPDGSRIAVGVDTGLLYTFDVRTGERLHSPARVHHDYVQQVEWLPGGGTVVSTGGDRTMTLYDVSRGLVRATLPVTSEGGTAHTYLLSATSRTVSALSGAHPGRAYPLDPPRWLDHACAVAGRDLTRDEWAGYLPGRPYRATCTDR